MKSRWPTLRKMTGYIFLTLLILNCATQAFAEKADPEKRLFPANLIHADWQEFAAQGFGKPVTGIIYRGYPRPTCGMPLGGVGTGCLDIESNGMLGYNTIFNELVNPRRLLNLPFLGLSVGGKTWVLVTNKNAKEYTPRHNESIVSFPSTDYTPRFSQVSLEGVRLADSIDYWGHYPMLDMEFKTAAPVEVGLRTWNPFIPGDSVTSMTPGIVFEFSLRNTSSKKQKGTLAFSFPGFGTANPDTPIDRSKLNKKLKGIRIKSPATGDPWEIGYVLAAINRQVRRGGPLNADGKLWSNINKQLPQAGGSETGASIAHDFNLDSGESKLVKIVLTWSAPYWNAKGAASQPGGKIFTHMYAKHYPDAESTAQFLLQNNVKLRKKVIAWQEVVYQDKALPGWLADSLINNLHLITECAIWGQAKPPVPDWASEKLGLFGLNECPRGCPQIECIPCSFYGNLPVVYFFPECALSTLYGYKNYQFEDGRPPWIFGGVTADLPENKQPYDISSPDKGYQTVLNGACYVVMADRYWRRSGDDGFLEEFWDSLKRCNDFSMSLRPKYGDSQVMAMPEPGEEKEHGLGDTEWFEAPEPGWKGYVTHAGAVRMAQVNIMRRMAEKMGDGDYVAKCDRWFAAGADVLENKLWTGKYYLNFYEPETNLKSDLVFGYQLDGEWIADWHGVRSVFPKERVRQTLDTLKKYNCQLSQSGAVNYASPDGKAVKIGGYGTFSYFPPELMMLAMNYMYEDQKEFGIHLLRKWFDNCSTKWGYTWDGVNTTRGDMDTGQRAFGADYYQNMMLWGVPAAITGTDLSGPSSKGGLVERMIAQGKK